MYLEWFGLQQFPFQLTPDSDFLYMSTAHARAKAYMDYALWNRDGFVVITGEVGAGKTTLIQKFLRELGRNVRVAKIFQTQVDEYGFLQALVREFGIETPGRSKADLLDAINRFLLDRFADGQQVVLIVDEAQNLTNRVLEEIRLLSGIETRKEKILHVLLVGQPELKERLEAPELAQLMQRVRLRFHLRALAADEIRDYVQHRLDVAGAGAKRLFSDDVYPVVHEFTGGIPRLINTLCDTALTCAFAEDRHEVTAAMVRVAIEELQWQPYRRPEVRPEAMAGATQGATPPDLQRLMLSLGERLSQLDGMIAAAGSLDARLERLEREVTRQAQHADPGRIPGKVTRFFSRSG